MLEIGSEGWDGVETSEVGSEDSAGTDEISEELAEELTDEADGVDGTDDSSGLNMPGKAAESSQPIPNSAAIQTTINITVSHGRFFLYIYFDRLTFMGETSYDFL